ncbi:hypothetical protein HOH45_01920 [bacterium]|mgnify:CR=1 FL=1|jgi:hypothetical protein|nr:hypothetical protein [bacterium]
MLSVQRPSLSFSPETKNSDGGNRPKSLKQQAINLIQNGKVFHKSKEMDKAIEAYSEAIEKIVALPDQHISNTLSARAHILRSNVYREQNDRALAAQDAKVACNIDPTSARYIRVY